MSGPKGLIGAVIGGILGVIIWAAIGYITGYEIGFVAVLVGLLVGAGAAVATGGKGAPLMGVLAAVIAVGAIVGGKLIIITMFLDDMEAEEGSRERMYIAALADEVLEDYEARGVELYWPETEDEAEASAGYPPVVWKKAQARWTEMSPAECEAHVAAIEGDADSARHTAMLLLFFLSLRWSDFVWGSLAVGSAFKLASARRDPLEHDAPPGALSTALPASAHGPGGFYIPGDDNTTQSAPPTSKAPIPDRPIVCGRDAA